MSPSKVKTLEIRIFQVGDYTFRRILERNVTCSDSYLPMFGMKYLPPSSGYFTEVRDKVGSKY